MREGSVITPFVPMEEGTGVPIDDLCAIRMGVPVKDLTRDRVETYQLEAFRRTLRYVKEHSDFYRERFADIDPDTIRSMADIERVPCTDENDLAGNEWRFQCVSPAAVRRIVTVPTTGTKGKRKRLSFSEEDQRRAIDFIYRGYLTMNCVPGEKMIIYMSGTAEGSIGDLVRRAMEPLAMDISVYGPITDIAAAYERLMEFRPEVVEAVPWHAAALARYGEKYGNPEKEFIRSVNLSADAVPDAIVNRLERLWGCTVHRHYGSTEMCIFGGCECLHHMGYHIRPCDILCEIPEPDENGLGEILITTLDREAMPLIRYKTGDIGVFNDETCGCGCRIRRLGKVCGRKSDTVRIGKNEYFLGDLAGALYEEDAVTDFEITLADEYLLTFTVRTLPEETVKEEAVREHVLSLPGMREAVNSGQCGLAFVFEESASFPEGYNLKKKVAKIHSGETEQ